MGERIIIEEGFFVGQRGTWGCRILVRESGLSGNTG